MNAAMYVSIGAFVLLALLLVLSVPVLLVPLSLALVIWLVRVVRVRHTSA